MRTSEMLLASAQVIGHRTRRMALAGPLPSRRDRDEFVLMGREKLDAAVGSAAALGCHWLATGLNTRAGEQVVGDWLAVSGAARACLASRTPWEWFGHQARLMQAMARLAASTARLGDAGAVFAGHGLKPIHAAATANARRLGR